MRDWERQHYVPGGNDAFLFYLVYGNLAPQIEVDPAVYRSRGLSDGLEAMHYSRERQPDVLGQFLEGYLWDQCKETQPSLASMIESSDSCVVLRGSIPDPPDLNYFRDAIGTLTAMCDSGAVSIYDPQMFRWWHPDTWRSSAFEPDGPVPRHHVTTLVSPEPEPELKWFHTRGLRKFGRPDVSIRNVPPDMEPAILDLCDRFIEFQAFGGIVEEGQEIRMAALPPGGTVHHQGHLDDPEFNNVHFEIRWSGA